MASDQIRNPVAQSRQSGRFVLLGDDQVAVLRRYGTEHGVTAGDVLFADGDDAYDFIVVLDGKVDIVEHHGRPDEAIIASYGPDDFLGEMSLLTGQRVILSAIARSDGRVLRVPAGRLRVVMAQEADLSELILRVFLLRHARLTDRGAGLTLVGSRFDADTRRLLQLLARNRLSSKWLELEGSPEAEAFLRELKVPVADLPIVLVPGGTLLRNPTGPALLDALGLTETRVSDRDGECDLLVVGGGPAGLAAAVYGASEGLTTTLAEDTALGGQAGTSSRIENYLGFPAGLSGDELTARAVLQAQKFGVRIRLATRAVALSSSGAAHTVRFDNGETVAAKSVIVATGVHYNRLPLDRLAEFEGVGVYYAATQMEAQACWGAPVAIVGGGNSAGQAALFLAHTCSRVHIVIRGDTLANSMSRYLIEQIEHHPEISISTQTEVTRLVGEGALSSVELRNRVTHEISSLPVCGMFVFIGAKPSTEWLGGQLAEDGDGFLLTGADIPDSQLVTTHQVPLLLETSRPGIFCVGDVRARSIKRVATAVGEGSMAVRLVFERLKASGLGVAVQPKPSTEQLVQSRAQD